MGLINFFRLNYRIEQKWLNPLKTESMTLQEVIKDLNGKCIGTYFQCKLFRNDSKIYARRTFGDLFKYYRPKGVSEKLLLEALVKSGFSSYRCPGIKEFVFFKFNRVYRFWAHGEKANSHTELVSQKYTFKYLNKLYDSIFEE